MTPPTLVLPVASVALSSTVRRVLMLAALATAALLVGCAHPISIEATTLPEPQTQRSDKKVAYVMTEADRQKQVITPGGGGDKVSYFPYKDFERALRAALRALYSDVSVIPSPSNPAVIKETGAAFVFVPQISTDSSSPSLFTWPPTRFSVSVSMDVLDAEGKPLTQLRATGEGAAEFGEFMRDFGLAGRRASGAAAEALVREIQAQERLR